MRQFKLSATFGIVGVFVVAGLVAVIALNTDQTNAQPKGTYALIFGIIAAYLVLLFVFQRIDLARAEAASTDVSPAVAGGEVENPATLDEADLWALLAVHPIDAEALKARKQVWGVARASWSTSVVVTVLIFLSVPPIYLLDTFVPLFVGGGLIAAIALWKSVGILSGGGDLGRAYAASDKALAPLGLSITEKLRVRIEPRYVGPTQLGPRLRGATVMEGERHGRGVRVRMPAEGVRSRSEVHVSARAPEFELRARDGRLKAGAAAPPEVERVLAEIPNSTRWNGVKGSAGAEGITIERKGVRTGDWLLDLWLAERLAVALDRAP